MRAIEIGEYGSARDVIRIVDDAPEPSPGPGEILVRVAASSVNPIDCAIRSGYGQIFFKSRGWAEFPIRLGRDVAGVVAAAGPGVDAFKPGQRVYAAILNNALAEFALVNAEHAALMPGNLTFRQAASIPYVALTAWSALVDQVGLGPENTPGKRIFIPRGAGGVGSFAIQLVKAWGAAEVASMCSTGNVELVRSLGADTVIDYSKQDFSQYLHDFDVAFDTGYDAEQQLLNTLKKNTHAAYVSIVTPKMRLTDKYGLEEGVRRAQALFGSRVEEQQALGRRYYWSFMEPNGEALATIAGLLESGRIRPVIDRVLPMDKIVEAHEYCESKRAQGKIVIDVCPEMQS